MSVLYNGGHDVQMEYSHECKSFDIYIVTIKISMTEYHHSINRKAHGLF